METENGESKSKMDDYEVVEQIGRGSFGSTFLVLHKIEKKKYVLKKINMAKSTEKFKRTVHQELNSIAKINHPYIVDYKDAWVEKESSICVVSAYFEGGDMYDTMRKARGSFFPEEKLCKWLTQLLVALDYLHSNRVFHGNLKCSNIFLRKNNDVCLGDFGLAKILNTEDFASSVVGRPNYMCPEIIAEIPYGYTSDIWFLGCCMFEIAAHHPPFRAPDMAGLINKINRSSISPLPIVYSSTLKQIIKSMLRKSPEHRPTAAELLRHHHLQPYLLRCRNPSSAVLPVKSPTRTKDKIERIQSPKKLSSNSTPTKQNSEKGIIIEPLKETGLVRAMEDIFDLSQISSEELDFLYTKRVDPVSYSANISVDDSEQTSSDSTAGDLLENPVISLENEEGGKRVSNGSLLEVDKGEIEVINEAENPVILPENEEGEERVSNGSLLEVDKGEIEVINEAENPVISQQNEEGEKRVSNGTLTEVDKGEIEVINEAENLVISPQNEEGVKRVSNGSLMEVDKGEIEVINEAENPVILPENEEGEKRVSNGNLVEGKKGEIKLINETESEIKVMKRHEIQRAEALESLLELCAGLLKQNKLEELAGVLKPFGEDQVSSRETAILLTRSLIAAQKSTGS